MNPEETQQQMSPEDAKATLGLATRLSEQMLMTQAEQEGTMPVESPEDPQEAPQETQPSLRDNFPAQEEEGKIDEVLDEIGDIKAQIKEALEDDGEEDKEDKEDKKDKEDGK